MDSVLNPPTASDEDIEQILGHSAGLVHVDMARMSRLLCDQLVHAFKTRQFDMWPVTDVLEALDNPTAAMRRKPNVRPYNRPPLGGLWHAHIFNARYLPENLRIELGRKESRDKLAAAFATPGVTEEQAINLTIHAGTAGLYKQRAERGALTGEWLVYAQHEGQNFYLTLAQHGEGDQVIYDRIMARCQQRFQDVVLSVTRAHQP